MTITKDFASKLVVAFVAIAMVFTAFASSAKAQTTEDLQKMINDLLAQVAALQAGAGQTATAATGFVWTRDLNVGATGADVKELQKFLNSDADTRVSVSGAGSAGSETEFYGPATAAAVSKFQVKYRSEILSPANLVNPTGYFGPSTRAKANALNTASAPVVTPGDDSDDEEDDEDDSSSGSSKGGSLQGEANLEDFEVDDPSDSEIEEGAEDQEIAELTVQFEEGDGELDRIDFQILAEGETNTNNVEPWDVFETISLWIDGDKVAEEDVDSEDDWLDEDDGIFRFSNLGIIGREDEDVVITVAATIQNGLETNPAEIGDWELGVFEVRYFDADGESDDDNNTDEIGDVTSNFEIQEEGDEDEIFVRSSTNDPDSTTIELEDDETSDFITVFVFDLDTEDSQNDIMVEGLRVDVAATEDGTTATSAALLIDDVQLVVNGEIFDDWSATVPGQYVFDLDDEEFWIDAGDRVEVEFQVEFEALSPLLEGATIEASADSANLDAEGPESLIGNQLSGSAVGEEHTLRTEGAILAIDSIDELLKVNDDQTATDDEGVFTIVFEVTAFESDLYVNKTAASGTAMGTVGANYLVEDNAGNPVGTGTSTGSLTSTADTDGTRFRVNEGETETFTLTVEYDPATQDFYQLQLYSLNFNVANANPNTQQRALDESDYETDALSI